MSGGKVTKQSHKIPVLQDSHISTLTIRFDFPDRPMHALYNYRRQIKQHSAIMTNVETTTHQPLITVAYAIHLRWVSFKIAYEDYYSIISSCN